ncbi:ABC-2 family transporter protein [Candidatus Dojkabacteria bacterium]|nr:ABC-2 family transporter protein [Candidatus Dojkabacteria bacterium]
MKIRKHLRVATRLIRLELMTDFQYRLNFLFSFIATSAWLAAELLFMGFLLQRYNSIAGWNLYEIGVLIAVNQIWTGGAFFLIIWPSLISFARSIKSGDLDRVLALPINTRFYISISQIDITSLAIFIEGVALLIVCLFKINISLSFIQILLFTILLLVSCWIVYCFQFIAATLIFWLTEAGTVLYSFHFIDRLSRFPYEIFSRGVLLILFTFVLPATIICNIPARALLNILDLKFVIFTIAATVWFTIISHIVWKFGVKRYESASS